MEGGPGGNATWDNPNADMVARAKDDAAKGVGANRTDKFSDNPIINGPQSPTARYDLAAKNPMGSITGRHLNHRSYDLASMKKRMRKQMKK